MIRQVVLLLTSPYLQAAGTHACTMDAEAVAHQWHISREHRKCAKMERFSEWPALLPHLCPLRVP